VLISGVSGGSLATAYYVHRLRPVSDGSPLVRLNDAGSVADLRNTTRTELINHLARLAETELGDYSRKLCDPGCRGAGSRQAGRLRKALLGDESRSPSLQEVRDGANKIVEERDRLLAARAARPAGRQVTEWVQAQQPQRPPGPLAGPGAPRPDP